METNYFGEGVEDVVSLSVLEIFSAEQLTNSGSSECVETSMPQNPPTIISMDYSLSSRNAFGE